MVVGSTFPKATQDIEFIELKLKERFSLQHNRKYKEADDIRDMLRERFGVFIIFNFL